MQGANYGKHCLLKMVQGDILGGDSMTGQLHVLICHCPYSLMVFEWIYA